MSKPLPHKHSVTEHNFQSKIHRTNWNMPDPAIESARMLAQGFLKSIL